MRTQISVRRLLSKITSVAAVLAVVVGGVTVMSSPAHAVAGDEDTQAAREIPTEATPAVQVDARGAKFELLGDGRWKLTIPANEFTVGWATPTDCFGSFYPISEHIDTMYWGAEQTCDRPDIHYPQHIDLWLQARCTFVACWYVDEDYRRSPFSEDYTRVTHANGTTRCANGDERYFRMRVQPTVRGVTYGSFYSSGTGVYNCGV